MSSAARGRTAEQLIEDGIAPVKAAHWREAGPRVPVQAITSNAAPAQQKKSKRQQKKERKERAATDLCFNFAVGSCNYGTRCKFSHDVAAYVASRSPDLPGSCPNSSLPSCPFGITCRWASTHANPDPMTKQFLVKAPAEGTCGLEPAQRSPEEAVVPDEEPSAEAQPPEPSGQSEGLAHMDEGTGVGSNPGEASTPSIVFLPVQQDARSAVNILDKSVQGQLRKGKYDFAKADAVLASLGIKGGRNGPRDPQGTQPTSPAGTNADAAANHSHSAQHVPAVPDLARANGHALDNGQAEIDRLAENNGQAGENGQADNKQGADHDGEERPHINPNGVANLEAGAVSLGSGAGAGGPQADAQSPALIEGPTSKKLRLDGGIHVAVSHGGHVHPPGAEAPVESAVANNGPGEADMEVDREPTREGPYDPAGRLMAIAAQEVEQEGGEEEGVGPGVPGDREGPGPGGGQAAHGGTQEVDMEVDREGGREADVANRISRVGEAVEEEVMDRGKGEEEAAGKVPEAGRIWDLEAARNLDREVPLRALERRRIDWRGRLYLAPLTTVGNLPFRRVCKGLGAEITCGEMAMATNLLQGQASEWALLKRHPSEDIFGVQVCGGYVDAMTRCAQLLEDNAEVDFVDVNFGCPIDCVTKRNAGSACLTRPARVEAIARGMSRVLSCDLTLKVRKGFHDGADVVHTWLPRAPEWGVSAVVLHGRTRQQRYTKQADWQYIKATSEACPGLQLIGNGDVLSQQEYYERLASCPQMATAMIARAALIKPWIFTEIAERRDWDISAGERLDLLKQFCSTGLMHWGSDSRGVETTRRFLLEWLSFLHRYVPVGLLEIVPQKMHWRPPPILGRSDLETLLASDNAADWVRISEMLLGPAPPSFVFAPKHKSNSYAASEVGMAHEAEQENG